VCMSGCVFISGYLCVCVRERVCVNVYARACVYVFICGYVCVLAGGLVYMWMGVNMTEDLQAYRLRLPRYMSANVRNTHIYNGLT
jgi:hypothetical protein